MQLHYGKYRKHILKVPQANTNPTKGGLCVDKNSIKKEADAKLRELRKGTGLSIFKVGRAIGVSGNYISQIERGDRPASDAVLVALSDLYHVDQKGLFGLYGRMPSDEINKIMALPELRQLFIDVTGDKKVNPDNINEIIEEFKIIAKKYYDKGDN